MDTERGVGRTEGDGTVSCCAPTVDPRIARRFDAMAREWAAAADFPQMVPVSARLLELLAAVERQRPSVLELGSGSGALSVALLERGAARLTGIDLSEGSVDVARRRAEQAGVADRARFEVGDAADAPLAPHDWVILDRVICCFAAADRLVDRALAAAGSRVALSVPESRGWRGWLNRPVWRVESIWDAARGGCPGYVHDVRRIEERLAARGFRLTAAVHERRWHVAVYDRSGLAA